MTMTTTNTHTKTTTRKTTTRQRSKREFDIGTSGQFRNLAMFFRLTKGIYFMCGVLRFYKVFSVHRRVFYVNTLMGNQISRDCVCNIVTAITRIFPIHPNILKCNTARNVPALPQRFVMMMMMRGSGGSGRQSWDSINRDDPVAFALGAATLPPP